MQKTICFVGAKMNILDHLAASLILEGGRVGGGRALKKTRISRIKFVIFFKESLKSGEGGFYPSIQGGVERGGDS